MTEHRQLHHLTHFFPTPSGGSEGATMRFKPESDHGGNAGLGIARKLLEPIKEKHPEVSYADLYILAGIVAIEGSNTLYIMKCCIVSPLMARN